METQELKIQKLESLDDLKSLVIGKSVVNILIEDQSKEMKALYENSHYSSKVHLLLRYSSELITDLKLPKSKLHFTNGKIAFKMIDARIKDYEKYNHGYYLFDKELFGLGL